MGGIFPLVETNNHTCLCSHRKGRLTLASTVDSHDAERVFGVGHERLDFSGGGGHCVFPKEAIGILDSYDIMGGPSSQVETDHQGAAIFWFYCLNGIHHLRG